MFDLGKWVTEQWESGEELLGRAVRTREREREREREKHGKRKRKKKYLFVIVCEEGVLGFQ